MGALTNKPMAFNSRNWEYNTQLTFDLTDFLSPRIRVDQFNGKVYRILPTVEWISNRIRFLYLGLRNQRVNTPITSHFINFEISLKYRNIFFEKQILMTVNYENSFKLLKSRLILDKNKSVSLIYGNVFDTNTSIMSVFENAKTVIKKYSEITNLDLLPEKLTSFSENESVLLVSVNPRLESPLLDLRLKENTLDIASVGNFSFSYPVKVLSNNSKGFLDYNKGFLEKCLLFFGLSNLKLAERYAGKKVTLIPLYLFNNYLLHRFEKNNKSEILADDVNVSIYNQNSMLMNNLVGFNLNISSHFENNKANLSLPIAGYLETNFKYLDKDLKLNKLNSLKPNYGLSDLFSAFSLFLKNNNVEGKKGNNIKINNFKVKFVNTLASNSIPNYLVRDPLGRANPLFNN